MGVFVVNGRNRLEGEVRISGGKNAALPMLAASLLTKEEVIIHNCPRITDVFDMKDILLHLGAKVNFTGNTIILSSRDIKTTAMPEELSHKIRSSIFLLGSMLGRKRKACFFSPGGCEIGKRPIDQHLYALNRLGVQTSEEGNRIHCKAERLTGGHICLSYPSVGATENAMLAATLAEGRTIIENAAREPEIVCLEQMLVAMGAKVYGAGTGSIIVDGVKEVHGAEVWCMPDRIEAGTFLIAAAMTKGEATVTNIEPKHLEALINVLQESGERLRVGKNEITIFPGERTSPFRIITAPYPGFPTDMQALMCAFACVLDGVSSITETVFENRMKHVYELMQGGANISVLENTASITGVEKLFSGQFTATDLRGGAALVLAALAAEGESRVMNIELIDRGYERFEHKLSAIGADIRRI